MVHIQERALGTFKQQIRALLVRLVEFARHIGHHGTNLLGVIHGFLEHCVEIDRRGVQDVDQHMVVQVEVVAQTLGKPLGVLEVLHTQSTTGNLVLVGWTNATTRGANFGLAGLFLGSLTSDIQRCVVGQDERTSLADAQT